MKRRILFAIAALFVMTIYLPADASAQPGRGNGWGNSPYARRLKMERKIEKERAKFRRKAAQQRFKDSRRAGGAYSDDYYIRRDRDDRYYGGNDPYYDDDYYYGDDGSVYDRHRNVINIAIGAGTGAAVGAIVDGKKGALIGAGVGAGAAALYTYVINPKDKRRPRYYRD